MGYKVTFSTGMAGKVMPGDTIEEWEKPRFGRYWWLWTPSARSNGGRFSRTEVVDINFNWLCFWFSVTFWPVKSRARQED